MWARAGHPEVMDPDGGGIGSIDEATLSERVDSLLTACRRRGAGPRVDEVERLYTDGCAEILTLEAEQRRLTRRLTDARFEGADEARELSRRFQRVSNDLGEVRHHLRQLRAALEWAQSGAELEDMFDWTVTADVATAATPDRS